MAKAKTTKPKSEGTTRAGLEKERALWLSKREDAREQMEKSPEDRILPELEAEANAHLVLLNIELGRLKREERKALK